MLPKYYKNEMIKNVHEFLEAPVIMQASVCCIFFMFIVVVKNDFSLLCKTVANPCTPLFRRRECPF